MQVRVRGVGGQGGRFKGKPRGFRCWGVGLRAKPGRRVVNNRAGGGLVCSWCECKCAVSQLPVQTATCIFTGRMAKQTRFLYTPRRYKAPGRMGARILKITYPPSRRHTKTTAHQSSNPGVPTVQRPNSHLACSGFATSHVHFEPEHGRSNMSNLHEKIQIDIS